MSQKHLSRTLSKLLDFVEPNLSLEQYLTNSDVAAELLWSINMRGFLKDKVIIDLGAGTGVLGIGALLLGAKKVVFLEKDARAIEVLEKNIMKLKEEYELPEYEIICCDVALAEGEFDVVIMNPPFGTKTMRADTMFLEKAFELSNVILSIHKTSTRDYIKNLFKENNYALVEIFDFNYSLKKTFEHHLKPVKKIEVSGFLAVKS